MDRRTFVVGAAALVACGRGKTAPGGDDSASTGGGWATGGTAAMGGDYPDPFAGEALTTCALQCAMTMGPCYAETLERRDISEGVSGLPVRLALRVVDDQCRPVAGAVVDVWHAAPNGLYSGPDADPFCTGGDAAATSSRWFRGTQTTDADGRVDFDTCYPGWYPGRAVHIHFQVRVGGTAYVTSQLFFPDAVNAEVYATHPDYTTRGQPDTTDEQDGIAPRDLAPYTLETARMTDGAMLAWKTLVVRSTLDEELCQA